MKRLLVVVGLTLSTIGLSSQAKPKPMMVVNAFTTAEGVELPYDMKLIQTQLVAEELCVPFSRVTWYCSGVNCACGSEAMRT